MKPKTNHKIALVAVFTALFGISCQAATIIVNDTFADGNRTFQDPPDSLAWYTSSNNSTTLTATVGAMTMNNTLSGNQALAYFTDSGSPLTLSVGEKLVYTVSFYTSSVTGSSSATGLRFGLLNSGGSRISADGQGTENSVFNDYTGYAATFGNANSNTQVSASVWERTQTPDKRLIATQAVWTVSGNHTATGSLSATPTTYTLTMTIDYQALDNMTVTGLFTGGSLSDMTYTYVDATPVTSFDTLVFWMGTNPFTDMVFTSVNLEVIPEPTTAGLLAGALGVGAVIAARRRRRS